MTNLTDFRQAFLAASDADSAIKPPVRLAATVNVTPIGIGQTIDGAVTQLGDRILLTAQTDARQNGIRVVSDGVWPVPGDFSNLVSGTLFTATAGVANAGQYSLTTSNPIILGVTALTFMTSAVGGLAAETAARIAADNTLQGNINTEASTRATNDTAEVNARIAAVSAEAGIRASADTTLQANITAEASARVAADTAITTNLAASTGASLVGFTQSGAVAVSWASLQERDQQLVYITDFMTEAQRNDGFSYTGSIDVTSAAQKASDASGSNPTTVIIPPGKWLFNQTTQANQWTLSKSNVSIVGFGWASQLVKTNSGVVTGNQAIVMVRPLTADIGNIQLRNFRITGPTTNNGTAISGDNRVVGIMLHDGTSAHVISDVLHDGVLIEGMETGGFLINATDSTHNCKRVKFIACWARNCRQDGFNDFAADANEDITLQNCYATDLDGYGAEMSSAKGLLITGCVIRRVGQGCIGIEYGATSSATNHVQIVGNKLSDIGTTAYTTTPGITLGQVQNPKNTLIESNVITRCGGQGILINGTADTIDIIGNTIKDVGSGGAAGAIASAGACTNTYIVNNTLRTTTGGFTMNRGVSLAGAGSATNLIANNEVSGATVVNIDAANPTRVVIAAKRITVTYSASMTFESSQGNEFDITATDGNAFTINAPSNSPGDGTILILMIRNASGGALGPLTLNAIFKSANTTQPANNFSRSRTFRWNGTNLVQIGADVDVPN